MWVVHYLPKYHSLLLLNITGFVGEIENAVRSSTSAAASSSFTRSNWKAPTIFSFTDDYSSSSPPALGLDGSYQIELARRRFGDRQHGKVSTRLSFISGACNLHGLITLTRVKWNRSKNNISQSLLFRQWLDSRKALCWKEIITFLSENHFRRHNCWQLKHWSYSSLTLIWF